MLKFARIPASLYVWVVLFSALIGLNRFGGEDLYLRVPGGRYLVMDRNRLEQTDHNDFEVREGNRAGFFVCFSGSEAVALFVFLEFNTAVECLMSENKGVSKLLRIEEVEIFSFLSSLVMTVCSIHDVADVFIIACGIIIT